jgi:hypothetical protein
VVGGGVVGGGVVVVVGWLVVVVGRRVVGVVPRLGGFELVIASPRTAAATAPEPFGCDRALRRVRRRGFFWLRGLVSPLGFGAAAAVVDDPSRLRVVVVVCPSDFFSGSRCAAGSICWDAASLRPPDPEPSAKTSAATAVPVSRVAPAMRTRFWRLRFAAFRRARVAFISSGCSRA